MKSTVIFYKINASTMGNGYRRPKKKWKRLSCGKSGISAKYRNLLTGSEKLPFTFCADICISGKLFGNLAEKGTRKDPILNWWSLGYSHSKQFSIYSLLDKVLFRSLFLLLLYNVAEKVANQICKALYSPKPHGNQ